MTNPIPLPISILAMMPWPLAAVILAVNLAAFAAMGLDKHQARRHGRRIREATLMGWALAGGGAGALAGMLAFRHKTRHPLFRFGLPLILILQLAVAWWILRR